MQSHDLKTITGGQIRAARALLRWSAEDLAENTKLGVATVRRAEALDGPVTATPANAQAIREVFERAGLEFISENGGGVGIRFRDRADGTRDGH